jgi:glutamate--cysteine ligase catalytic subunit
VESTPNLPYGNYTTDLLRVERNMILRRRRLISALRPNEITPYVTCFVLLGVGDITNFVDTTLPFSAIYSESTCVPDMLINPHPRFGALTQNIRLRRGEKVDITVPLFPDVNTPEFHVKSGTENDSKTEESSENVSSFLESDTNIHMDCMAFGMGMCCLQVTFQARDVDESRYMYDQLAVLAPIMLSLTAATPIFKGRLSNTDTRWSTISQSVDDRTRAERGLVSESDIESVSDSNMVGDGVMRIHKSRYDSISTYIYHCNEEPKCKRTFEIYNDIPCPIDPKVKEMLLADGVDENLAHHIAHLFTRDPLVVFEDHLNMDDSKYTDHFENIQSTNWQTCRWKPPPPRHSPSDPDIGWRTEFRSMEVQLTDFENAAFSVFIALVSRVILAFDLVLYIPLSKVCNIHISYYVYIMLLP